MLRQLVKQTRVGRVANPLVRGYANTTAPATEDRLKHLNFLAQYYDAETVESILKAEAAIKPEEWAAKSSKSRMSPGYFDDFTEHDPFYDHATNKWTNFSQPRQPVPTEHVLGTSSAYPLGSLETGSETETSVDTKLTENIELQFYDKIQKSCKVLQNKLVTNQTGKGKISSFYVLVAVGDGKGMLGLGEGKDALSFAVAMEKAKWKAARSMKMVPRYQNRTIYGEVYNKYHAVHLTMRSAPAGHGLRVNPIVSQMCDVVGITDLTCNVYGSRNPMNVAKAAFDALTQEQIIPDSIAQIRGKKLVNLNETYFAKAD
ncbi:37S ribosomal protein S5 [Yarrowia sp. C11]|nr:37S ribosomal protein S5 [Yarrowia sp. E02]KAG5369081.1 37S ribosomal protein S5 [Yarrowia sp. C11]